MGDSLRHSVFHEVFFPVTRRQADVQDLTLQKVVRFQPAPDTATMNMPMVVFDFETTGLDSGSDEIIEIGALKFQGDQMLGEYSLLINPGITLTDEIIKITGISNEMLQDKPRIGDVLDEFLEFFRGSVLVAHNAEFDMAFLTHACRRHGVELEWPAFCTLKMARTFLPELPSKNLDTLAEHYGLTFEARHRSVGDCKVTLAVLRELLNDHQEECASWSNLQEFYVTKS